MPQKASVDTISMGSMADQRERSRIRKLEKAYIKSARAYEDEGILEFDENPRVSMAITPEDPVPDGAYVACWRWVGADELTKEEN